MKNKALLTLFATLFMLGEAIASNNEVSPKMGGNSLSLETDNTVFYAKTNKLKIPVIYYRDENGMMTDIVYAAELEISNSVAGKAVELKLIKFDQTDIHGCILPETWQESMGHCMVQN